MTLDIIDLSDSWIEKYTEQIYRSSKWHLRARIERSSARKEDRALDVVYFSTDSRTGN